MIDNAKLSTEDNVVIVNAKLCTEDSTVKLKKYKILITLDYDTSGSAGVYAY